MKKIMPIYGTRPEAIKVAPIVKALKESELFDCVVTVTGQHREMLDQVNELFDITPDYDLDVIQPRQTLNSLLTKTINGLDEIFEKEKPDAVVVQGDTTTSTAGAIAAFYRGIPVIHAEAGLRSYDIFSPFPEEANRKMTSQVASLHLAPTSLSQLNLINETIDPKTIAVTGNTVIDALFAVVEKNIPFSDPKLEELVASGRKIVLVTTHRRENQGEPMKGIGRALARLSAIEPDVEFILPLHRNPAVREALLPEIEGRVNITLTEPLAYGEFTRLIAAANIVLTDSGGVQEEAPSLAKPVLVMRENTERPEAVVAGTVKLIGTDEEKIFESVEVLLNDAAAYDQMALASNPYGDGKAAIRTVAAIAELLGVGTRMEDFDSNLPSEASLVNAASI
ncbi:UDP-N-acetylglucosamine 2-epimerase (non-hydrolyzing) [Paeniglutamicibacter gangotriensis]|uniref:UDP-N-acetylglucosamine 2-epimerase (non-hydrolyzing) n=1 Tax=Paeniglutamicibacter gangotriensis TaxID=254787 RepID=A0A5B0EAX5_9MICC|nr:UDP-N-acetylglucosamine 2-epimerase (non-hydrolyzing) [Paeniglutamicibacter gangotriensis]KAA0975325.1 UDP-N-acetylglucosamine 2-epimerase (non-hydrolyzing) [Paeniglutamicibacter gangotriensis]